MPQIQGEKKKNSIELCPSDAVFDVTVFSGLPRFHGFQAKNLSAKRERERERQRKGDWVRERKGERVSICACKRD